MTRAESAVPLRERVLSIEGIVAPSLLRSIDDGQGVSPDDSARWLFVSYAYADIPRGRTYDHWWAPDSSSGPIVAAASVDHIKQQYGNALDVVPHGWKTIIRFRFTSTVPQGIDELPVLRDWSYQTALLLGTKDAWTSQ